MMTFYKRNKKNFVRPRHIHQPRRLSRKQLRQRELLAHNNALWRALKQTKRVYFEGGSGEYYRFMSVNTESPVPYFTKHDYYMKYSLLLPNMVVSDGPLPTIGYRLGKAAGRPALLTDLTPKRARKGELLLYVLQQHVGTHAQDDPAPHLSICVETIDLDATTVVDGRVVLTDSRFANPMMGFGLVQVVDGHASLQRVVTRCTYYERYTTEEALQTAAKSYGGLTE